MYDATIKDRVLKESKAKRKELQDHRRRRLIRVIAERYDAIQAGLARVVGMTAPDLGSVLAGRATFGDYRARKIEQAIGLPWGWLDTDDPHLPRNLTPDPHPYSKPTGRTSKYLATFEKRKHKREPRRSQRVAA